MGLLNIFNVLDTKSLVSGPNSLDGFTLPLFIQGENPSVNFYLLTKNFSGGYTNPWTKILPGTFSLRIGIYDVAGNQLAFQSAFTVDATNNCLSGTLTYNSGNVTTALGANSSVTVNIEFEITDASGVIIKTYQAQVTLAKQILPTIAVTVPQTEVGATQSWVSSNFFKRLGSAGEQSVMISPAGNKFNFYIDDDGEPHWDRLP